MTGRWQWDKCYGGPQRIGNSLRFRVSEGEDQERKLVMCHKRSIAWHLQISETFALPLAILSPHHAR